jgi:hypothetical protein
VLPAWYGQDHLFFPGQPGKCLAGLYLLPVEVVPIKMQEMLQAEVNEVGFSRKKMFVFMVVNIKIYILTWKSTI